MKKLALALTLLLTTTVASAHGWEGRGYGGYHGGYYGGYNHYENHYHGNNMNWVAPALIGGIIGYTLNQPRTVYNPPPVIYTQQPGVIYQNSYCTPWTETVDQYGVVTRTRTCTN